MKLFKNLFNKPISWDEIKASKKALERGTLMHLNPLPWYDAFSDPSFYFFFDPNSCNGSVSLRRNPKQPKKRDNQCDDESC